MAPVSEELLARVQVEDYGVVEHSDPLTGETWMMHDHGFFVVHDGVEYGVAVSSSPDWPGLLGEADLAVFLRMGRLAALEKAGLYP